jgi:hypothetical protein
MAIVEDASFQALRLTLTHEKQRLGSGTGIIAQSSKGPVLITARHNLMGRRADNGAAFGIDFAPDEVVITHNRKGRLGEWIDVTEPLLGPNGPLWWEHPNLKGRADVAALPLTQVTDVDLYTYDLSGNDLKIACRPSDVVSVIGFPFGLRVGGSFAIWATGFVASEPDFDFDNLPVFLIDCRTRPGQSGSAVVAYRSRGAMVAMEDGSACQFDGPVQRFLGIYTGRIDDRSDIGMVWKAGAIRELLGIFEWLPTDPD